MNERREGLTDVLTGTFRTNELSFIETNAQLGAVMNGPYRSLYAEIGPVPLRKDFAYPQPSHLLKYPADGVGVSISTGLASHQGSFESFFPLQPSAIGLDEWSWSLPPPGGPVGAQITDTELENRLRRRADIAGLFMGVFVALAVQIAYELARSSSSRQLGPPDSAV